MNFVYLSTSPGEQQAPTKRITQKIVKQNEKMCVYVLVSIAE